ncbi:MAG: tRNA pseudouridine(55) synthase TruB [Flavobacteriaceae bacterium]
MNFFDQEFSAEELLEGRVFCLDKPLEWTSFQVVNKVRGGLKKRTGLKKLKVGHAGTLDPLATGLLIICTGKKTKTISTIQNQEKVYEGVITLGASTPSYDLETPVDQEYEYNHLSPEKIIACAAAFQGEIEQYPPLYSALKKEGKRLYEYAREGKQINIAPRKVHLYEFEIVKISLPQLFFKVRCSKGTYIRSLANDFGKALNSGAHLSKLRRLRIGNYEVDNAFVLSNENQKQRL